VHNDGAYSHFWCIFLLLKQVPKIHTQFKDLPIEGFISRKKIGSYCPPMSKYLIGAGYKVIGLGHAKVLSKRQRHNGGNVHVGLHSLP
jgi:hypothetical protein